MVCDQNWFNVRRHSLTRTSVQKELPNCFEVWSLLIKKETCEIKIFFYILYLEFSNHNVARLHMSRIIYNL
jgi:hypothetical protein